MSACDEAEMQIAAEDRAETRGITTCLRAVQSETGADDAFHNTAIAVVEVNQFVIDVPQQNRWICYTDETGRAQQLVKTPLI